MSHHLPKEADDLPPSIPPPSYEEALNAPPVPPTRPAENSPQGSSIHIPPTPPPPQPHRPQGSAYSNSSHPGQNHPNSGSNSASTHLYTNNPNLPYDYPRGYFCSKCKNTGFKEKNGKPCSQCWPKFFKNKSYNPNPNLNFKYPRGFICEKCHNTGIKLKNGLSCQDCYTRYAPRNYASQAPITYSHQPFSTPFGQFGFGPAPGGYGLAPPAAQILQPGDPRMGGTLCGRCRGSGRVTFFLDQELCSICGGVGRLFNAQHPAYR